MSDAHSSLRTFLLLLFPLQRRLIAKFDPELSRHLDGHGLGSSLYGLRWITTLMSREFPIPAVCRIWDTLFADPQRFDFLTTFSIAVVRSARDKLLTLNQARRRRCRCSCVLRLVGWLAVGTPVPSVSSSSLLLFVRMDVPENSQMDCVELLNNSSFNDLPLTSNLDVWKVFDEVRDGQSIFCDTALHCTARRGTARGAKRSWIRLQFLVFR